MRTNPSTGAPGVSRATLPRTPCRTPLRSRRLDWDGAGDGGSLPDRRGRAGADLEASDDLEARRRSRRIGRSRTPTNSIDLIRERDDYREALIRLQADFENYKKRMIKQQTDHLERAAGALVEKLLPVLDTADLALAHGGGEDVKQLSGALAGVLEREGLERIDPLGVPFDPTLHDAVAHEPGEGGAGGRRGAAGRVPLEGTGPATGDGQSEGVSGHGTPA